MLPIRSLKCQKLNKNKSIMHLNIKPKLYINTTQQTTKQDREDLRSNDCGYIDTYLIT